MSLVVNTAGPALQSLLARVQDRPAIHKVMGVAAIRLVKDGFTVLAHEQRNPFGRPPMFWKRMNRATRWELSATGADVVMPREVAQRYYGGTIRPTGGRKFLAIPLVKEAYRRAPRTFTDLDLIITEDNKRGFLVRRAEKKTTLMYALVRKVTQAGNRGVLPGADVMGPALRQSVREYLLGSSRGR